MNIAKFRKRFPDEAVAEAFFASKRWEGGKPSQCSNCAHKGLSKAIQRSYRCNKCRKYERLFAKTILDQSTLPLYKSLLSIYIVTTSRKTWTAAKFSKKAGVSDNTARKMLKRLEQFKPSKKVKDLEFYFEMIVKRIIMGLVPLEETKKEPQRYPDVDHKPLKNKALEIKKVNAVISTKIYKPKKTKDLAVQPENTKKKIPLYPFWQKKNEKRNSIKIIDKENVGYGVTSNSVPFLTGKALADACGVDPSRIYEIRDSWNNVKQNEAVKYIKNIYTENKADIPISPCSKLMYGKKPFYIFDENAVLAFVEYFASEKKNPKAKLFNRSLLKFAFRTIVFKKVGYDPKQENPPYLPANLKEIQAKKNNANPEKGILEYHWIVVRAITEFVLDLWHMGYAVDAKVTIEGSVGYWWSKWVKANYPEIWENLETCTSRYAPDDLRGRGGVEFEALCYHEDYYFKFKHWLENVYKKTHFIYYTLEKIKDHEMGMENLKLICDKYSVEYPKELKKWIDDNSQGILEIEC